MRSRRKSRDTFLSNDAASFVQSKRKEFSSRLLTMGYSLVVGTTTIIGMMLMMGPWLLAMTISSDYSLAVKTRITGGAYLLDVRIRL